MANITDQQVASADSTEGTTPAWFDQGVDLRQLSDEVTRDEKQREIRKSPELIWLEESAELALRDYLRIWDCHDRTTADDWLARQLRDFPELRPWEHYIRTGTPLADRPPATDDAQPRNAQPRPEGTHPPGGGEACGSAYAHDETHARQDRRLQEFEGMGGWLDPNTLRVYGTRGALPKLLKREQQRGNLVMAGDRNTFAKDIARAIRRRWKREQSGT